MKDCPKSYFALLFFFIFLFTGCKAYVSSQNMIPQKTFSSVHKNPIPIPITINTIKKPLIIYDGPQNGPKDKFIITSNDFDKAIKKTILNSQAFEIVDNEKDAIYQLNLSSPAGNIERVGFTGIKVDTSIMYSMKNLARDFIFWNDCIKGSCTLTAIDTISGNRRQLTIEGAIRDNLHNGVKFIAENDLKLIENKLTDLSRAFKSDSQKQNFTVLYDHFFKTARQDHTLSSAEYNSNSGGSNTYRHGMIRLLSELGTTFTSKDVAFLLGQPEEVLNEPSKILDPIIEHFSKYAPEINPKIVKYFLKLDANTSIYKKLWYVYRFKAENMETTYCLYFYTPAQFNEFIIYGGVVFDKTIK